MATFMKTADVAARWDCDRSTVTARARSGELVGMRIGTDWRFSVAAVEAYERRHTSEPAPEQPPTASAPTPKEVRPPVTVDGFTLPADYEPVFKDLWPGHVATTQKATSQRY